MNKICGTPCFSELVMSEDNPYPGLNESSCDEKAMFFFDYKLGIFWLVVYCM